MTDIDDHRADFVLLAAYATSKAPRSPADIGRAVTPYLAEVAGESQIKEIVGDTLTLLRDRRLIDLEPGAKRGTRVTVTSTGEEHLRRVYGAHLKRAAWQQLVTRHAIPLAAGITDEKVKPTFGIFRAVLLADALGYGDKLLRLKSEAQILNRLLAQIVEARTETAPTLSKAIVRRWLRSEPSHDVDRTKAFDATVHVPAESESPRSASKYASNETFLAAAAAQINQIARTVSQRDGMRKAFINRVWEQLRENRGLDGLDEAGYKRLLIAANQRGLVRLTVAALAPAYPQADVRASAIEWRGETFHLIETD